jgi:uncharacterized membrane protein
VGKHSKALRRAQAATNQPSSTFQITAHAAHFSGPLPPPEILVKYNEALPGCAERIIAMAETQSKHRQSLESKVIESKCNAEKNGPIYGFIICMTAIIGGIFLIYTGKSPEGLASIGGSLAGLVAVFVYGKRKQAQELRDKAQSIIPR